MLWPYYWSANRASPGPSGGPGGSDPYAAYLVYDTFTGADATELSTHAPEKKPGGSAWVSLLGTFALLSNKLKLSATAGDGQNAYVIQAGVADVTIQQTVTPTHATLCNVRICFNAVDIDNYWLFIADAAGNLTLYEKIGGSFTVDGVGVFSYAQNVPFTMKVITSGDAIECYLDGVLQITYSTAGRPLKAATKHGVSFNGSDAGNSRVDDFSIS